MADKIKREALLRVVVELQYSAPVEAYGTSDATEMAMIDQQGFDSDPALLIELLDNMAEEYTVRVTPVKDFDDLEGKDHAYRG